MAKRKQRYRTVGRSVTSKELEMKSQNVIADMIKVNRDKWNFETSLDHTDEEDMWRNIQPQDEKAFWSKIKQAQLTDRVFIDDDTIREFKSVWDTNVAPHMDNQTLIIPTDLFFSHHIPILDTEFVYTDNDQLMYRYRVIIFPDYYERVHLEIDPTHHDTTITQDKHGVSVVVGIVVIYLQSGGVVFTPISVICSSEKFKEFGYPALSGVMPMSYGTHYISEKERREMCTDVCKWSTYLDLVLTPILIYWYCTQISLLNPVIQNIFKHPTITTEDGREIDKKTVERITHDDPKKVRVKKYIKKHVLNKEAFDDIRAKATFNRKCMLWYVIGHWRTYKKTGKRIFIQPYWKGKMRDIKNHVDVDPNTRVLAVENTE